MTLLQRLYDALNTGRLTPQDLDPDLAAIQVWVRLVEACALHPDGACGAVAIHEFAVDATSCIYARCDPDGAVPETTTDIAAVRLLWSNGQAEAIGPERLPGLRLLLDLLLQGA